MKAITIKCPNCGAGVYVDEGKTRYFCSNCGEPIIIDDEVDKHVNVNISYDKTRERELDQENLKYMTASRRLELRIKKLKKVRRYAAIIGLICFTVCFIVTKTNLVPDPQSIVGLILCSVFIPLFIIVGTTTTIWDTHEKRDKLDGLK